MTITELTKKHGIYAEDENKNHSAVNIESISMETKTKYSLTHQDLP